MPIQVKLPKMEVYQKDVLNYYIRNPKSTWIVTKSPRQVGKSILIEILLVYASLSEAGSRSMCISPIFKQSKKLFDEIKVFAQPLIKCSNNTSLEITFMNNSKILFGSAEQGDNLRGFTVKKSGILCVDEAAFIDEDFFYNVLVACTNVYNSDIFLFSTPKFKQGLFYDLFQKGLEEGNVKSFNWADYDLSKFLPQSLLDTYRDKLPKLTFQCEYLAEFISGEGSVFTDFKKCIGNVVLDTSRELVISVDWGTGSKQDDTAITIGQSFDNYIGVERQIFFNDKNPSDTLDYILSLVKEYTEKGFKDIKIVVEQNSIGAVYKSMLIDKIDEFENNYNSNVKITDEIALKVTSFITTNQSKKKAIERLSVLFEQNKIVIPNLSKLHTQLSMFEAKTNNLGTITYAGANGSHDDLVLSLLFLISKLYSEI